MESRFFKVKPIFVAIIAIMTAFLTFGLNYQNVNAGGCRGGCDCDNKFYHPGKAGYDCAHQECWHDDRKWDGCNGHAWYDDGTRNTVICRGCLQKHDGSSNSGYHRVTQSCKNCNGHRYTTVKCTVPPPPPVYYTLTVNVNDSRVSDTGDEGYNRNISANFDSEITITVEEGYTFGDLNAGAVSTLASRVETGWHLDGFYEKNGRKVYDANGKTYGNKLTASSNITIYARYARNSYSIVFKTPNPGTTAAGNAAVVNNGTDFTIDGYYFIGNTSGFNGNLDFCNGTKSTMMTKNSLTDCRASVNGFVFDGWYTDNGIKVNSWKELCDAYPYMSNAGKYSNRSSFNLNARFKQAYVVLEFYKEDTGSREYVNGVTDVIVDFGDSKTMGAPDTRTEIITTTLDPNSSRGGRVSPSTVNTSKTFNNYWEKRGSWPANGASYSSSTNKFVNGDASSYGSNIRHYQISSVFYYTGFTLPVATNDGLWVTNNKWYNASNAEVGAAGMTYIPHSSGTIHVNWTPVSLGLYASPQMNGSYAKSPGYTDLSWGFASESSSQPGVYKLYEKKEGSSLWSEINITNKDTRSVSNVDTTLSLATATSWTAPYTGYYTFTLYGAKGSDCGSHSGGKGGTVTMTAFMAAGNTINFDEIPAGSGNTGANGGAGCYINLGGYWHLATVGGGGGANAFHNGGAGGIDSDIDSLNHVYAQLGQSASNGAGGGGGGARGGSAGAASLHYHTDPFGNTSSSISDNATYTSSGGCFQGGGKKDCNSPTYWCIWSGASWGDDSDPNSAGHREMHVCPYCGMVFGAGNLAKPSTSFTPGDYGSIYLDNGVFYTNHTYNDDGVLTYCFWDGDSDSYQAFKSCCAYYNIPLDGNDYPIGGFGVHNMGLTVNGMTHHWYFVCVEKNSDGQYVGSYRINNLSGWLQNDSGATASNTDLGQKNHSGAWGGLSKCPGSTTAYVRNCGHTSGEIVSSSAATGGTIGKRSDGWDYGGKTNFCVVNASIGEYNGTTYGTIVTIPSGKQDFFTDRSMTIPTPDTAKPDGMRDENIKLIKTNDNNLNYEIVWSDNRNHGLGEPIKDNGTAYYYKCESFLVCYRVLICNN